MSCPAVIDVFVSTGPAAVDVVTPGPPGPPGSQWITGIGVPSPSVGTVGDLYLRQNGDVYGPKTSGGWGSVQFTLTGAGGASLSDDTPQPLGTASAGTSFSASRSDHRHAMPSAAQVGADPTGTAAAVIASHLATADPHSQYTTPQEAAAAAPVQSVALSLPSGWSTQATSTSGNVTLSLGLPAGQALLAGTDKTAWDAAAVLAGTAVQPAALATSLAGKADLVGGVVPSSQIPALAITEYLGAVANQSALLALTGQRGDWAIRLDRNSVWILSADTPSQLASWIELPIPSGVVLQVNGQTGVVTLSAIDVGADPTGTASNAIAAHLLAAGHLTQAQARTSINAALPLSYDPTTGAITWGASGLPFDATGNRPNLISLVAQASVPATPASGFTLFADSTGRLSVRRANGNIWTVDASGITTDRVLIAPNTSGTLAITNDYQPFAWRDDTSLLTASSSIALLEMPWSMTEELYALPRWTLVTAPTGSSCQFDIQRFIGGSWQSFIGGSWQSIYSVLPTIASGQTSSDGTAGTFTTAFAASPVITANTRVRHMCLQIGSSTAGAGLRWVVFTRTVYG